MAHIAIAFDDGARTIGVFVYEDQWLTEVSAIVAHLGGGYSVSAYASNWHDQWTHRVPLRSQRAA